jgi:hypothetical protein
MALVDGVKDVEEMDYRVAFGITPFIVREFGEAPWRYVD